MGVHSAWIEIFNRSFGSADLAGCLLKVSNQPGDTATYFIPKGDVMTLVKPRQHALFWLTVNPTGVLSTLTYTECRNRELDRSLWFREKVTWSDCSTCRCIECEPIIRTRQWRCRRMGSKRRKSRKICHSKYKQQDHQQSCKDGKIRRTWRYRHRYGYFCYECSILWFTVTLYFF